MTNTQPFERGQLVRLQSQRDQFGAVSFGAIWNQPRVVGDAISRAAQREPERVRGWRPSRERVGRLRVRSPPDEPADRRSVCFRCTQLVKIIDF